jgi:uncharacterized protein YndB with AHSA1/START domain
MAELRMDHHFDAAPERVFRFLTEESGLLQWWVPDGMTAGEHALDLTRQGAWRLVIVAPGGGETVMSGKVLALEPGHYIETTFDVAYAGMPPMPSTVRFELAPDGAGTRLTLIQSGISEEMVMMGKTRGWPTSFARLAMALKG